MTTKEEFNVIELLFLVFSPFKSLSSIIKGFHFYKYFTYSPSFLSAPSTIRRSERLATSQAV
ncbi:hypothetical protein SAMN04488508_10141 [Aquimarina spongiae]|uniref:Uncharacterized protein n=1 Tax=Aquimarina spongiae TaxID=570521 RepID=A0A1M6A2Q5_9FLAO|nr:hypothetical protein SAMN04488508_10141 [Aquimarina spongiae]